MSKPINTIAPWAEKTLELVETEGHWAELAAWSIWASDHWYNQDDDRDTIDDVGYYALCSNLVEIADREIERLTNALTTSNTRAETERLNRERQYANMRRLLVERDDNIERLRNALLCEECNGSGWVYCAVADTSTPCRNCEAYTIREAAKAGGDDECIH